MDNLGVIKEIVKQLETIEELLDEDGRFESEMFDVEETRRAINQRIVDILKGDIQ